MAYDEGFQRANPDSFDINPHTTDHWSISAVVKP